MSGLPPHTVLFRSDSVVIRDYQCCRRDRGLTAETLAPFSSVAIPRRGVFVKHVHGQSVVADTNHAIFFNHGETYRLSHPYGCGDRVTEFGMMPRVVSDIHRSLGRRESRRFSQTHCPIEAALYLVARHIFRLAVHGGPIDAVALEEIALRLVGRITAGTTGQRDERVRQRAATSRAHDELADAVMLLLAARYAEPLTLDLIASDVHSSPYHLCRVFKTRVGRSVHRYLTQLRLRAALERVAQGERRLTRLATEVGFSSHSHLSHAFRREFGTTPSAVRAPLTAGAVRQMSKILTGQSAALA